MVNLKKLIQKEAEKAVLKKAVGKILPMDSAPKPDPVGKAKLAGVLTVLTAGIAALLTYLQG
jgi:hypothetical protein